MSAEHVSYGPVERDFDRPIVELHPILNGRWPLSYRQETRYPLRRKRFVTWRDAEGRTWGRWDWADA